MSVRANLLALVIVFFGFSGFVLAQETHRRASVGSCQKFVQEFYDWYLKISGDIKIPPAEFAVRKRPYFFDLRLRQELENDYAAQRRLAPSEGISGVDFDPFLGTQDPGPKYMTKNCRLEKNVCFAEVSAFTPEPLRKGHADVIAELRFKDNRWQFFDFYLYSDSTSTGAVRVSLLKELSFFREMRGEGKYGDAVSESKKSKQQ